MSTEDTSAPRREFLARAGLAGLGAGFLPAASLHAAEAASPVHADILITGARVYTMDDAQPEAEAVALAGDRILAVGSNDDVGALAGPGTQLIDGRGTTVLPGFIDAHSHPDGASEVTGADVNLRSIAAIQDAMRKQAGSTPPGHWVIGYKYDDTKLSEGRPVNRHDLDEAVPGQPAIIRHRGGHTAVVNTPGLELAGITADTPDPDGGRFGRDNGELTGFIADARGHRGGRRVAGNHPRRPAAGRGLPVPRDGGFGSDFDNGRLGPGRKPDRLPGRPRRRRASDKTVVHASERTMRMSTPFEGRPDDYGILTMSQDEIDAAVDDAVASGWRIGIHANGDVTVDMALNAYERVLRGWQGPNPRLRLEHCSLVNPDLLRRIRDTGSIPAPFYTYAHYHGNKWVDYGAEKMQWMFAHKSFLDYGIAVAPASDYTPGPFEPLMAIQSMVTRKDFQGRVWGPNQRITVPQALRICTVNGAWASMEEAIKGSLAPGKLADLVMLGADPHATPPDEIKHIPVLRTMVGGKFVYEA
jgi:predicted amidohydrolase YtcJ